MKKTTIFLFFFVGVYSMVFAQSLINFKDETIPQSPTTAALAEYGFSPVSLATGTPNTSVPIWTIEGNDLKVPIQMSYRPGVKIVDISPYTGHGWSLFGGGVITRQLRSDVDLKPRSVHDGTWILEELTYILSDTYDPSADIFNYNFGGLSGQFAIKDDFQSLYYVKDRHNWKFTFSAAEITITTEDGTQYVFGETETTTAEGEEGTLIHDVVVSWHLTEVISAKADERIVYTYYDKNILPQDRLENNSLVMNPGIRTATVYPEGNVILPDISGKKVNDITLYVNNVATTKVAFEATTPRTDLQGTAHALSKISVYAKATDNVPLKYFDVDISQIGERLFLNSIQEFSGDGSESIPPYEFTYNSPSSLPGRYVYKSDNWGYYSPTAVEHPYKEEYHWRKVNDNSPSWPHTRYGSLKFIKFPTGGKTEFIYEPNKYHKQDWDYTNKELELNWDNNQNRWEKTNGASSTFESTNFTLPVAQEVKLDMCLKLVKGANCDWGILRDEVEEYSIRIKNSSNQTVFSITFDGNGDPDEIDMLAWVSGIGWVNSEGQPTGYAYESYGEDPPTTIGDCLWKYLHFDLPAGAYTLSIETHNTNNYMESGSTASVNLRHHNGNMINHQITGGGIRVVNQEIYENDEDVVKSLYYKYIVSDANGNETNQSSGELTTAVETGMWIPAGTYHYFEYDPDCSCYVHMQDGMGYVPMLGRTGPVTYWIGSPNDRKWVTTHDWYHIKSIPPSSGYSWNLYKEVKVREVGSGFKIHKFHGKAPGDGHRMYCAGRNVGIDGPFGQGIPAGLSGPGNIDNTYGWPFNGNLVLYGLWDEPTEILTYSDDDYLNGASGPVLLQEEIFDYYSFDQPRQWNLSVDGIAKSVYYGVSWLPFQIGRLTSKEVRTYENSAPNIFSNTLTEYEYNSSNHYLPTKVTTTESNGKKIVHRRKYSVDYQSNISAGAASSITMQALKDKNIFGPIEEQIWKGTSPSNYKLTEGKLNIYDKVSSGSSTPKLYQPKIQKSLEANYPVVSSQLTNDFNTNSNFGSVEWLNNVSNYDYHDGLEMKHDTEGRLIEIIREDAVKVSYIWGYNRRYPVAKVENASRSQIDALSGFGNNYHAGTGALSTSRENTLRSQLPNAMVTTYTFKEDVGITSVKDPRENIITYHYDKLNRLEYVTDQNGEIVSQNSYNYKN